MPYKKNKQNTISFELYLVGVCLTLLNFELSIHFDKDYYYPTPYLWKIWPGFTGELAKYYGHTWALTLHWFWFEFSIVKLK
jgi:hypothetical protein